MNKGFIRDALGWGLGLWLIGYVLGMVLFAVVPVAMLGWAIMPFGVVVTLWVLFKKIKSESLGYYVALGLVWTVIAVVADYFLLVKLLNPADGYYKLDVYLYYVLTLVLPVLVWWVKKRRK